MADLAQLNLKVDSRTVVRATRHLDSFERSADRAGDAADRFKKAVLALAASLVGLGTKAVSEFARFEQSALALESLIGSAQETKQVLQELRDFSERTPFALTGLVNNVRMMKALGTETRNLTKEMTVLADTSAAIGGNRANETLRRLALNIGEIRAQQRLDNEDIRRITEVNVPLLEILEEASGLGAGEIRRLAEERRIPGEQAVQALFVGLERRFKKFSEVLAQSTLGQLLTTLNVLQNRSIDVGKAIDRAFDFKGRLESLRKELNALSGDVVKAVDNLAGFGAEFEDLDVRVKDVVIGLRALGAAVNTILLLSATKAVASLGKGMLALIATTGPLGVFVAVLATAVGTAAAFWNQSVRLGDQMYEVRDIVKGVGAALGDMGDQVLRVFGEFVRSVPVQRAMESLEAAALTVWEALKLVGNAAMNVQLAVIDLIRELAGLVDEFSIVGGTGAATIEELETGFKGVVIVVLEVLEATDRLLTLISSYVGRGREALVETLGLERLQETIKNFAGPDSGRFTHFLTVVQAGISLIGRLAENTGRRLQALFDFTFGDQSETRKELDRAVWAQEVAIKRMEQRQRGIEALEADARDAGVAPDDMIMRVERRQLADERAEVERLRDKIIRLQQQITFPTQDFSFDTMMEKVANDIERFGAVGADLADRINANFESRIKDGDGGAEEWLARLQAMLDDLKLDIDTSGFMARIQEAIEAARAARLAAGGGRRERPEIRTGDPTAEYPPLTPLPRVGNLEKGRQQYQDFMGDLRFQQQLLDLSDFGRRRATLMRDADRSVRGAFQPVIDQANADLEKYREQIQIVKAERAGLVKQKGFADDAEVLATLDSQIAATYKEETDLGRRVADASAEIDKATADMEAGLNKASDLVGKFVEQERYAQFFNGIEQGVRQGFTDGITAAIFDEDWKDALRSALRSVAEQGFQFGVNGLFDALSGKQNGNQLSGAGATGVSGFLTNLFSSGGGGTPGADVATTAATAAAFQTADAARPIEVAVVTTANKAAADAAAQKMSAGGARAVVAKGSGGGGIHTGSIPARRRR